MKKKVGNDGMEKGEDSDEEKWTRVVLHTSNPKAADKQKNEKQQEINDVIQRKLDAVKQRGFYVREEYNNYDKKLERIQGIVRDLDAAPERTFSILNIKN